ncbi:unnamed protein product [Echinostoma caproni]|uniref:Phage protein n=1 Tax=Echinostoma caproni TaxID=27848 RepID=A0A183A8I8_9TREM|nr:unnamed protein product [Echinostoma caproni]
MAISGLSPEASLMAIKRELKDNELKFTGQYDPALRALREAYNPKALRSAVIGKGENYPNDQLVEDVRKVYEMVGLVKPTDEEISLNKLADETKRMSVIAGAMGLKEDKRKNSKDASAADAGLMGKAAELLRQDMESKGIEATDKVSAGLKKMVKGSADKEPPKDEEPLSQEILDSLLAIHSSENVDMPRILGKIKKRGELLAPMSYYMTPNIEYDDFSLTGITSTGDWSQVTSGGPTDTHPTPPAKPSDMSSEDKHKKEEDKHEKAESKDKHPKKSHDIFDEFWKRSENQIEWDDDTFTDLGKTTTKTVGALHGHGSKVTDDSVHIPHKPSHVNGTMDKAESESDSRRYKITIIRAYSNEPKDSTAHVDAYLATLTEEDRARNRKQVTIIRALSRDAYGMEL